MFSIDFIYIFEMPAMANYFFSLIHLAPLLLLGLLIKTMFTSKALHMTQRLKRRLQRKRMSLIYHNRIIVAPREITKSDIVTAVSAMELYYLNHFPQIDLSFKM